MSSMASRLTRYFLVFGATEFLIDKLSAHPSDSDMDDTTSSKSIYTTILPLLAAPFVFRKGLSKGIVKNLSYTLVASVCYAKLKKISAEPLNSNFDPANIMVGGAVGGISAGVEGILRNLVPLAQCSILIKNPALFKEALAQKIGPFYTAGFVTGGVISIIKGYATKNSAEFNQAGS